MWIVSDTSNRGIGSVFPDVACFAQATVPHAEGISMRSLGDLFHDNASNWDHLPLLLRTALPRMVVLQGNAQPSNHKGGPAHQDGLGEHGDDEATGKDAQVLREEGGRHDEARGADEEREEELLQVLQLMQRVLLLLSCTQHHPRHKRPQLRRQALQHAHQPR